VMMQRLPSRHYRNICSLYQPAPRFVRSTRCFLLLGMLVPYNQRVVRDRTVAGHVALRGWLATRLDDRLGLLTRGCRTAVPRHQTLRATLDWSHETLRRAERTALCRLAVFTTTFDTQAACALMVDEEIKATDVPERLTDLAEKSLLTVCWAGEQVLCRLRQTDDALPEEYGTGGWTAAARKP
jgi:hypothetical protein